MLCIPLKLEFYKKKKKKGKGRFLHLINVTLSRSTERKVCDIKSTLNANFGRIKRRI